jgi:hypothetical protein
MRLAITYQSALERYPKQVAEILAKLQSGKSREKGAKPEELDWHFDWCVRITGAYTFNEMIENIGKKEEPKSIDEQVKEYEQNCSVCLTATKGRWVGYSSLIPVPPEILESCRKGHEQQEADKKRFDALTPEQKNAEVNGLLKQLGRSKGFMAFSVERKP